MTTQHAGKHRDMQSSRNHPRRVSFAGIVIIASVRAPAQPIRVQSSGATANRIRLWLSHYLSQEENG